MAYEGWAGYHKLHWKEQKFLVMNCNPDVELSKSKQKKFDRIIKKGQRLSVTKGNRGRRHIRRNKRKGRK